LAKEHFDLSLPYTKQAEKARATVLEEVCGLGLTLPKQFHNDDLTGDKPSSGTQELREQLGFQGLHHDIP